jgi:hypothetical protein
MALAQTFQRVSRSFSISSLSVPHMGQKAKTFKMGRGIFSMLAVGTLPILFMNPLQYCFALIVCGGISFGLAFVLV